MLLVSFCWQSAHNIEVWRWHVPGLGCVFLSGELHSRIIWLYSPAHGYICIASIVPLLFLYLYDDSGTYLYATTNYQCSPAIEITYQTRP